MAGSSAGRPDKMSLAPRADSWRESCSPTATADARERRGGLREEGRGERGDGETGGTREWVGKERHTYVVAVL